MAKNEELVLSTSEFAKVFGKTPRWVNYMKQQGIFIQHSRGKYRVAENVQRYVEHIENKAANDVKAEIEREKLAWQKARRENAELKLKMLKGQLHKADDIELIMNDMIAAFRSRVLVIPSKISPQVVGKELTEVQAILSEAVNEALTELSEYDPQKFNDAGLELNPDDESN